jgi:hypothetical protein
MNKASNPLLIADIVVMAMLSAITYRFFRV